MYLFENTTELHFIDLLRVGTFGCLFSTHL